MNIIVDSLPTKDKKIVWRSLVNLENVINALKWLKKHNKYYKNITIANLNNFPLDDIFIDNNSIETNNSSHDSTEIFIQNNEKKNEPMLKHKITCEIENHYTLFEQTKTIPDISDIEKYDQKRVETTPMNNKSQDLDHLCFPYIFPYGTGGMFDPGEETVEPTMYVK